MDNTTRYGYLQHEVIDGVVSTRIIHTIYRVERLCQFTYYTTEKMKSVLPTLDITATAVSIKPIGRHDILENMGIKDAKEIGASSEAILKALIDAIHEKHGGVLHIQRYDNALEWYVELRNRTLRKLVNEKLDVHLVT